MYRYKNYNVNATGVAVLIIQSVSFLASDRKLTPEQLVDTVRTMSRSPYLRTEYSIRIHFLDNGETHWIRTRPSSSPWRHRSQSASCWWRRQREYPSQTQLMCVSREVVAEGVKQSGKYSEIHLEWLLVYDIINYHSQVYMHMKKIKICVQWNNICLYTYWHNYIKRGAKNKDLYYIYIYILYNNNSNNEAFI